MGNRNRNQADWNSREGRGRHEWGPERDNFEQGRSADYGRGNYGRGLAGEFSGQQYGQSQARGSSSREEDRRRRGYYGLQHGQEDLSEFDRFGREEQDYGRREYRNYGENDWSRDRGFEYGQRNFGSNYDRDYNQNYGQPYSRTFGEDTSRYESRDFDRDRYQGSRGAREYQPQHRFGGEDWRTYSGEYGGDERWRGTANWGQGRREGSFDRDRQRNQSGFGGQQWGSFNRQERGHDYDRDDESLGDKIGKFFGVGPKGWKRSDDSVRDDVSERLEQDPRIDASNIEVQVREGEVTLTGSVPDRYTKRLAEDVAENCRGVKDVHNQLRVQSELSSGITSTTTTPRAGVTSETGTGTKRSIA